MVKKLLTSESEPDSPQTLESGAQREKESTHRPVVRIVRCSTRLLDRDNLWASVKPLVDQLRVAKLIAGDREDQIDLRVTQEKVKTKKEHGTLIEITYDDN